MKNITRLCSSISLEMPSPRPHLRSPFLFVTVAMLLLLLSTASSTFAGSATWRANPSSGDWNTAANWTPMTVPNGPDDTATFATSNQTHVSISAVTEVNGIVFNSGASSFTILPEDLPSADLEIVGTGIVNNSGIVQKFRITNGLFSGMIVFRNSATAGERSSFTNSPGYTIFLDSSNAGNSRFINNAATLPNTAFGETEFQDSSRAGNGTFINTGAAVADADPGHVLFCCTSTAANAKLIASSGQGAGMGGQIIFDNDSDGGTARAEVFGNGNLDITFHTQPGVTVGSIEGDGDIFLGAMNLTVGSNNLSTNFSGVIQDGGQNGGTGGSLTKIGTGKLVLSHRNTYTGGTIIKRGSLMVNNIGGSGTGSGPVQVNGGTLGGKGIIAGAVTVGTGTGSGAILSPGYQRGANKLGALTIESPLTFNADATYNVEVNSSTVTADEVIANGVTINSGAQFSFADIGSATLAIGTVFTVINNTSATPIAGTFSNLPDGSMFTVNGNTYQVNYDGGDGNDLTLTVVP